MVGKVSVLYLVAAGIETVIAWTLGRQFLVEASVDGVGLGWFLAMIVMAVLHVFTFLGGLELLNNPNANAEQSNVVLLGIGAAMNVVVILAYVVLLLGEYGGIDVAAILAL